MYSMHKHAGQLVYSETGLCPNCINSGINRMQLISFFLHIIESLYNEMHLKVHS